MKDILVVGPTGTVGSELLRQLASAGYRPRALVRSADKASAIASLATPVLGDLSKPETLATAFREAERVFILAPPTPELETLERNAIQAAVAAGAKRIVFLSNYGAALSHPEPHFRVHAAHEKLIAALPVDWTILQPTRFMTHTPFVWPSVLNRDLLIEGGGDGLMTVIDPADIAAIGKKALTENGHEGQTYELTSEDTFTVAQLAKTLGQHLGREIKIYDGGVAGLRGALMESGAPAEYAPLMAGYFEQVAAGYFKTTDTAGKLLGRAPHAYRDWLTQNLPAISSAFTVQRQQSGEDDQAPARSGAIR